MPKELTEAEGKSALRTGRERQFTPILLQLAQRTEAGTAKTFGDPSPFSCQPQGNRRTSAFSGTDGKLDNTLANKLPGTLTDNTARRFNRPECDRAPHRRGQTENTADRIHKTHSDRR